MRHSTLYTKLEKHNENQTELNAIFLDGLLKLKLIYQHVLKLIVDSEKFIYEPKNNAKNLLVILHFHNTAYFTILI